LTLLKVIRSHFGQARYQRGRLAGMHRDIKEMLIGSTAIVLFGGAVIRWPSFSLFVDQYFLSYLYAGWHFVLRAF
jgi:hypothetical protein